MQNQVIPDDSDRFWTDFLEKIFHHDFYGFLGTFYLLGVKMTIFDGLPGPESGTPARAKFWALSALERYPFGPPEPAPKLALRPLCGWGPTPSNYPIFCLRLPFLPQNDP